LPLKFSSINAENQTKNRMFMEEENHSIFADLIGYLIERHNLHEWIFIIAFFVFCRLLIGKSNEVGNMFLSLYGDGDENVINSLFKGFIGIYAASALLCSVVLVVFFVVKLIYVFTGYVLKPFNLANLAMECSFVWAIVACGYVRAKEKREYIDEINCLKKQLIKNL
jgi:hypothetical protein